ncbi:hypothetical protein K7X08_031080 [Anisodus acutangulus]|uniref:Uncharacterized protein n=1 Tax=Anisodus acutangulus TaxID=402998 RepID=A0A9Q1MP06_9SOLA|nr:hypothetical protein K7X08_031080 [Anisodus acutangulus]
MVAVCRYGTLCIRENPGCLFIATNRDAVGHLTDLQEWPGAGCMVAAICGTTQKEPITVGKPSTFLMDFLLQKISLTEGLLDGQNQAAGACVTNESTFQDLSKEVQPEYYTKSIADILKYI